MKLTLPARFWQLRISKGLKMVCFSPPKLSYVITALAFCLLIFCLVLLDASPGETNRRASTTPKLMSSIIKESVKINSHALNEEQPFNVPGTAQDDPSVIEYLRNTVLLPPSQEPYRLVHNSSHNPSMGQTQIIDKLLQGKVNGFFVECGGFDGESYSNSLLFERDRGWRGLMVEPDSENFVRMKAKNRKAYIARSCLAESSHPMQVLFQKGYYAGHILDESSIGQNLEDLQNLEPVQCFPLYSFLVALNTTTVDYFSLDVEGSEYDVLRNIPWDKVDISTLSVEYHAKYETYNKILTLMEQRGYKLYDKVTHYTGFADDFIFVKESILQSLKLSSPSNATA